MYGLKECLYYLKINTNLFLKKIKISFTIYLIHLSAKPGYAYFSTPNSFQPLKRTSNLGNARFKCGKLKWTTCTALAFFSYSIDSFTFPSHILLLFGTNSKIRHSHVTCDPYNHTHILKHKYNSI